MANLMRAKPIGIREQYERQIKELVDAEQRSKKEKLMTEDMKGLIFLLLMIPIGIRYFIKTGNNDLSLNKFDYAIAVGIAVVVILINL